MLLGDCSLWGLSTHPCVTRALEGAARKTAAFPPRQIASYLGSHWEMEAVTAPYTEGLFPKLPLVSGSFLSSQCYLIELPSSISTLPLYLSPAPYHPTDFLQLIALQDALVFLVAVSPLQCVLHGSRGPVRHDECCTCLVPRRRE